MENIKEKLRTKIKSAGDLKEELQSISADCDAEKPDYQELVIKLMLLTRRLKNSVGSLERKEA
jgi:hypothetical protein